MSNHSRNNQPSNSAISSENLILKSADSSINEANSNASNKPAFTNNDSSVQADSTNLLEQKTEDLMQRFEAIGHQAQILQGQILMELQNRAAIERLDWDDFIESQGIQHSTLCALTHQHRNRLINLAKFFEGKIMTGISVTVGYEISAPKNEKVAEQVYEQAVNQNLSVKKVQALIKSLTNKKTKVTNVSYSKTVTMSDDASKVIEFINSLKTKPHDALVILKTCYAKMQENIEKQSVIDVPA